MGRGLLLDHPHWASDTAREVGSSEAMSSGWFQPHFFILFSAPTPSQSWVRMQCPQWQWTVLSPVRMAVLKTFLFVCLFLLQGCTDFWLILLWEFWLICLFCEIKRILWRSVCEGIVMIISALLGRSEVHLLAAAFRNLSMGQNQLLFTWSKIHLFQASAKSEMFEKLTSQGSTLW